MSMDELRVALPRFLDALQKFDEQLAASAGAVATAQERLIKLGDDEFLRQFGARLKNLKDPVDQYQAGSPKLEDAVEDKIGRVERYFNG